MTTNGYVILDATGLNISSTASQTISGIGDRLAAVKNAGKPVVLVGLKDGSNAVTPTFCTISDSVIAFNGNTITVGASDAVTVQPNTANGLPVDISPAAGATIDLDDYKTPGKYRVNSATEAARVTHAPFTDRGYSIAVEYISNTNYILQTLIPANNANTADAIYRRHYRATGTGAATGWSPWYTYSNEVVS